MDSIPLWEHAGAVLEGHARSASGRMRKCICDGHTVVMKEWAEGKGNQVGFQVCTGNVLPSLLPGEAVKPPPAISLSGDA